ncbi:MAG: hypothetical protein DRQ55_00250 [Planctomycetota bacterium]|nr:MAG: hypothetical protein DRQ55_00250 [Planctomycetota bacterium]
MRRLVVLIVALASLGGCTYGRARTADLLDALPASIAKGWGVGLSLRATPLVHLGLAATPIVSRRVGYEDRLFYGRWGEYQASFPWSIWAAEIGGLPPAPSHTSWFERGGPATVYRWQAMRDAPAGEGERGLLYEPSTLSWGRHPPIVREIRGALLIPERRVLLEFEDQRLHQGDDDVLTSLGSPERASLWVSDREARPTSAAWDLFEADVMVVFFGVRVGVRPAEFVDFVLGFTTLDIMGDDIPEPVAWGPRLAPPPAEAR